MNISDNTMLYTKQSFILPFRSRKYHGRFYFLNVICAAQLLCDNEIGEIRRIYAALKKLLSPVSFIRVRLHGTDYASDILSEILDVLRGGEQDDSPQILSFGEDKALIYSAFLSEYGIDLTRRRIPWHEFLWLLCGLPDSARLSEVMAVRAEEVPPPNGCNESEREHIIRLKRLYALKKSGANEYGNGLERLFMSLERQTERNRNG